MHATVVYANHRPLLSVVGDATDPHEWGIDASDGDNAIDLAAEATAADVAGALASLGCRQIGPWHQHTSRLWTAAIEPA